MTDLERIKDILTRANIGFTHSDHATSPHGEGATQGIVLLVGAQNVFGYSGFYTQLHFDEKGSLVSCGVWE